MLASTSMPPSPPHLIGKVITGLCDEAPVFRFRLNGGKEIQLNVETGSLVMSEPEPSPAPTLWLTTPEEGLRITSLQQTQKHRRPCWRFECASQSAAPAFEVQASKSGHWRVVFDRKF